MLVISLTLSLFFTFLGTGVDAHQENDQVLKTIQHRFDNLGIEVTEIRTLDNSTGLIDRVAFGSDGHPVDIDALRVEEQKLRIDKRAGISSELSKVLARSSDSEILQVVFWLKVDEEPDFRAIINEAVASGIHPEEARRMARNEGERFFSPLTAAFARMLDGRGCSVDYVGTCWPIVIASTQAGDITSLASRAEVDQAYYCFPTWVRENDNAQPTLRTPVVHGRGNNGSAGAVKVMVQDSGGHVVQGNPYLPMVIWLNSGSVDYHATGVAGNVCMRNHPTLHGGAPGLLSIYSAPGWGDVDAPAAWDLGIQAGVSFGNCSWWNMNKGSIVFLDRYFDYIIRNYGVLMFKSNGNQGNTSEPYSTSPGNGYNMLCTGCYNDGDSHKWDDDDMASYSSWWNPVEGHEKPEVASPGDGVDTTATSSPWIYYGFGGTSSASPLTMGVATLIANRDPSIIVHPEAVKAVLMVSAWHNVEGDPVVSDKDGAGGVHAGAADAVVRDGQYVTGTFTTGSFPGGYFDQKFFAYAGDGTRVICLWQSDPDSGYSTDELKMDLDMSILDPSGTIVLASSASDKNPFELVYFEPPTTGKYTIRLTKQSFLGTSEPYCIAVSTRRDAATAEVVATGTGQIGTTMDFTFSDPYEYGENYVALLSLQTLPRLINLADGYILPLAWGPPAQKCYDGTWPGFVGTLDGSGEASTSLLIPNDPSLIGQTVYSTMLVRDAGDNPRDTSELTTFVIN